MKGLPLYHKLFNIIKKDIQSGIYKVGELLPSEKEIEIKYKVSRITVRRAMDMLDIEGYIEKKPGFGTILKDNKQTINLRETSGLHHDNLSENVTSKLISFKLSKPSTEVQNKLNLDGNEEVYEIERFRYINGDPIGIQNSYIPKKLLDIEEKYFHNPSASLYDLLKMNNIDIMSADETYSIKLADDILNPLLQNTNNFPYLFIERITYGDVCPIEYVIVQFKADKYKYHIRFQNE